MIHRIEIREKAGFYDAAGESVKRDIRDLGFKAKEVRAIQIYLIEGALNKAEILRICENLLSDPVTQTYSYNGNPRVKGNGYKIVEVEYNAGVMDPVEESVKKAIGDLGIEGVRTVKTAKKYFIKGALSYAEIHSIAEKVLYNKVIQHLVKGSPGIAPEGSAYKFEITHVGISNAPDGRLKKISRQGQLFLNLGEMKAIKKYFKKLDRNPTDCELETLAQTWSEHCKHKTFRGRITYSGQGTINGKKITKNINNLLKSTIMKVTADLKKPWCVSVFKDNSGIIRFDEKYNVCFKVETHNHPSALEPYGGAGTGIGGVIRDPLGTGLGAKPIINTDVFCFGPPDYPYSKLPKGTLHPKRVMKGVVAGVRDYGNRMGIPTSNGAVLFDENFVGNPLVFCGNVGIMP
ncbi:MAG: phosphoribosylformylglycinamidine synthase subunit PurS, partial [Candidatus Omnitrophota bacterium]|nr:phosphoribosylformylglycinamidine synthase subunit PurS [Candidatus Omnitrophota bacterium]